LQHGSASNDKDLGDRPVLYVAVVVLQQIVIPCFPSSGMVLILQHLIDVAFYSFNGVLMKSTKFQSYWRGTITSRIQFFWDVMLCFGCGVTGVSKDYVALIFRVKQSKRWAA
jgi:hypothetical protein